MFTTRGETDEIKVYKKKLNSPYEWEEIPQVVFFGRPAGNLEKRNYRILKGVDSSSDSQFIYASNVPQGLSIGDKIIFLGKEWTLESIGYYMENANIINHKIMSDEYIISRCPKGLTLR